MKPLRTVMASTAVVSLFAFAAPSAHADIATGSGPFAGSITYQPVAPEGCEINLALEGTLVFAMGNRTYAGPVSLVGSGTAYGSCHSALGSGFRVTALSLRGTDVFGHTLSCTGWRGQSVELVYWGLTVGGGECSFDGVPIEPPTLFLAGQETSTNLSNGGGNAAVAGTAFVNGWR